MSAAGRGSYCQVTEALDWIVGISWVEAATIVWSRSKLRRISAARAALGSGIESGCYVLPALKRGMAAGLASTHELPGTPHL
jgi:hypothetical protein